MSTLARRTMPNLNESLDLHGAAERATEVKNKCLSNYEIEEIEELN